MRCSDLIDTLPVFGDGLLSQEDEAAIETHLLDCGSCRRELAEYREISYRLRNLERPALPSELAGALREIHSETKTHPLFGYVRTQDKRVDTLSHWLMPFGAGAFCTGLFAFLFLSLMLVRPGTALSGWSDGERADLRAGALSNSEEYADIRDPELLRIEIPENSPEVNPAGALVALTRSIVRGKMNDEEVVVVADVFGNGLANLREVVEPPSNDYAARELERAFNTSPEEAPFLPAKMSKGTDAVRVVLKIQRVDVFR